MRCRLHGDDHPSVARIAFRLGRLARERGDAGVAEAYFRRCAEIFHHAADDPERARARHPLGELGELLLEEGRSGEAQPILEEAIALLPAGGDTIERADLEVLLGRSLVAQGREEEAFPLFSRSLAVYQQQLGPEDPKTRALRSLGRNPSDRIETRSSDQGP